MTTSLDHYTTKGGISVQRQTDVIDGPAAIETLLDALDTHRGAVLASSYEYPGRYTRWDMGFVDPPLMLSSLGRQFTLTALNDRGRVLIGFVRGAIERHPHVARIDTTSDNGRLEGIVREPEGRFPEEERSRQPSVFSVIRAIVALFASDDDLHLGLYGTFGYDLAFQFEPIALRLERPPAQRDLVLYLPDELYVVDHQREVARRIRYEFGFTGDDGRPYRFAGQKDVSPRHPLESMTTLPAEITDETGHRVAAALVRFDPRGLPAFLGSFRLRLP